MYGGTSVSDLLNEMGNTTYNNTKKGKIQQNLTDLLHANKHCNEPDCAELREFIGKFIAYKKSGKKGRAGPNTTAKARPMHAPPPSGPRPNMTAKAKPRNAPPPTGPAPWSATPAGRAEAAAAANLASRAPPLPIAENEGANNWNAARNLAGKAASNENAAANKEANNWNAARNLAGKAASNENAAANKEANNWNAARNLAGKAASNENAAANKESNNWNAARNLAGKAASNENAAEPSFTAAEKGKLQTFLNNDGPNVPGNFSNTNAKVVNNPLSKVQNTKKQIPNNAKVVNNPLSKVQNTKKQIPNNAKVVNNPLRKLKKNRKTRRNR